MIRYTSVFTCDLCHSFEARFDNIPSPVAKVSMEDVGMMTVDVEVTPQQMPHSPPPKPVNEARHICYKCAERVFKTFNAATVPN